jgi:hypothetical protein
MAKKSIPAADVVPELPAIAGETAQVDAPWAARKSAKRERSKCVRLSLDLSGELDFRLDSLAKIKRMHKGAFALQLIDQGLRGYKADVSLKNVYGEITKQSGEAA